MGLQRLAASLIFAGVCLAQTTYEFGGDIGYGIYRGGSVYSPSGDASAGILNRFATGAVFGQDLYNYVSGEIRYLYQDGHPYLRFNGVRTDIQGQSHAITYDAIFHFTKRSRQVRPF